MARYRVTIRVGAMGRCIGTRDFEAPDRDEALLMAYTIAIVYVHRTTVPRRECWVRVWSVSPHTGMQVLISDQPYLKFRFAAPAVTASAGDTR